jgi:hypothetical protein
MPRAANHSQTTTRISVELEKSRLSYVMKARKKKTAAETLQILLDEEAERLQSWNAHHELEGKIPRNQMDDRLL